MKSYRVTAMLLALIAVFALSASAFSVLEGVESVTEPLSDSEQAALNEVTSTLLFYQDFDHLEPRVYSSGEITSMIAGTEGNALVDIGAVGQTKGWGVISFGCTFEICEEENGNRYLKVTGDTYKAFGVWFENDALQYAVMSYNYMYPTSGTHKTLNQAAYKAKGTMYVGGSADGNTGNWSANQGIPITNNANTTWTQSRGHSYVQSPCLGLGFNQSSGTGEIYIDDFAVWSFSTPYEDANEPARKSAVSKTVSFANSTGFDEVAMPDSVTRCVCYPVFGDQPQPVTVNLNSFIPTAAPAGYTFAGWSASDGGTKIKDCHYSDFKVPGDITFYALWEKAKPVFKYFNDFESYEVGTDVLSELQSVFNNLNANNHQAVIRADENGNKYLEFTFKTAWATFFIPDAAGYTKYCTFKLKNSTGSLKWVTSNAVSGSVSSGSAWTDVCKYTDIATSGFSNDASITVYIDDLCLYNIPNDSDVRLPVTVTFHAGDAADMDGVTLPQAAVNGNLWVSADGTDANYLDLSAYAPEKVPACYRFLGWSRTPNGAVICENTYRLRQTETLYARYEKMSAQAQFEDFEGFEVGQTLTGDDLAFLKLNQFGVADYTATVVFDETTGSKVLKISSPNIYTGFELKNRGGAAGKEYVTFDYRFETAEGSRLVIYCGSSHEGSNQKATVARNTAWSKLIQGGNPTANKFGFFFDQSSGNYTIYLDNVSYWFIPDGLTQEEKTVTVTFANSTSGAPSNVTLPESITKNLWEDADSKDNTIDLSSLTPTTDETHYRFKGWSRTDGGPVIAVYYDTYRFITDTTLYAVWEIHVPDMLTKNSIRFGENKGLRFAAVVDLALRASSATEEYGFLVTRKALLGDNADDTLKVGYSELGDELWDTDTVGRTNEDVVFIVGRAWKKGTDIEIIYDSTGDKLGVESITNGTAIGIATVLTNIPSGHYTDIFVVRPYVKIAGTYYYGDVHQNSYYAVAEAIANDSTEYNKLTEEQKKEIQYILSDSSAS